MWVSAHRHPSVSKPPNGDVVKTTVMCQNVWKKTCHCWMGKKNIMNSLHQLLLWGGCIAWGLTLQGCILSRKSVWGVCQIFPCFPSDEASSRASTVWLTALRTCRSNRSSRAMQKRPQSLTTNNLEIDDETSLRETWKETTSNNESMSIYYDSFTSIEVRFGDPPY